MNYTTKQQAFIEQAHERISDDPASRLKEAARAVIARGNFVADAHCHLFDARCINAKYLAVRMLAGGRNG